MVNIREIELFDYIKVHNNKLCKKVYRLEISNLPYIIYKHDLYEIYKMVWYINSKFNIVGYKGEIVEKMLNNRLDEILYNKKENTIMTATNYIDFEMSIDEHEEFTLKYNDTLRTTYYLLTNKTGLIVNKKGIISLIAELYDIDFSNQYTDKSKQYEIYIKSSKYYCVIIGYLKKELCIDDLTRNATDTESLNYTLFNYIYDPFNLEAIDYDSYLTAIKAKYESEMYNPNDDIEFMASIGLSEENLETLQNVLESLSRPIDAMDWTDLQDRPQSIPP